MIYIYMAQRKINLCFLFDIKIFLNMFSKLNTITAKIIIVSQNL